MKNILTKRDKTDEIAKKRKIGKVVTMKWYLSRYILQII